MAQSIVGYTNDILPQKVVYTGRETDTTVTIIDNNPGSSTYGQIGVNVKDSALGSNVYAADASVSVTETSAGKALKVSISASANNRLRLNADGLCVIFDSADLERRMALAENNIEDLDDLTAAQGTLIARNASDIAHIIDDLLHYYYQKDEVYAKTETYSKEEVDDIVSHIEAISFVKVDVLPTRGEPNKIYLLRKEGSSQDIYDEYIWINER